MENIKEFFFSILYFNLEKAEKIYYEKYPDLINFLKNYKKELLYGGNQKILDEYKWFINNELDKFIEDKLKQICFKELFEIKK